MAETVANTLLDARVACPDLPDDTTCLRWLNRKHKELCKDYRLYVTSTDLTLDGVNREFSLNETYVSVWSADWIESSSAPPVGLDETSVDFLDITEKGWRRSTVTKPQRYYQYANASGAAIIGFDQIPTAASGGYPLIRLYVGVYTALTALGSLPANIMSNKVYVYGLCLEWAEMTGHESVPRWRALYENECQTLGNYVGTRLERNYQQVIPNYGNGAARA